LYVLQFLLCIVFGALGRILFDTLWHRDNIKEDIDTGTL
jgi:hypothetical protein